MTDQHARFVGYDLQLGGIRTGTLDWPQPMGGRSVRVAMFDTGSGLRFTVALDRGSDIVGATFNDCALGYETSAGLMPADHAHQTDKRWLEGWAGGLVTTCGPMNIGSPRKEVEYAEGQHGRYSNLPAAVLNVSNPDLRAGKLGMSITTRMTDSRMFDPTVVIERTISGTLGKAEIVIEDKVSNRGNVTMPHHWLYHCNVGYPMVGPGSRIVCAGKVEGAWGELGKMKNMNEAKRVPDVLAEHAGTGEGGFVMEPAVENGMVTAGIINDARGLGLRIRVPAAELPRLAVWEHFGLHSYVCGIEPFSGSLWHVKDAGREERTWRLEPGESRTYRLQMDVLRAGEIEALRKADGQL